MSRFDSWWIDDVDAAPLDQGARCSADCTPDCELPPVVGDPLRRLPLCSRVALEVAELAGGLTSHDVAWLLGLHPKAVQRAEQSARAKLARRLRAPIEGRRHA